MRGARGTQWKCTQCGHIILLAFPRWLWCPDCKTGRKSALENIDGFYEDWSRFLRSLPIRNNVNQLLLGFEEYLAKYEPLCRTCGAKLKIRVDDDEICPKCHEGGLKYGGVWIS